MEEKIAAEPRPSPMEFRRSRSQGGRTDDRFSGSLKISSALGALVGWYAGLSLLLPLALALLIGVVTYRLCSPSRKPLLQAFSVQAAQTSFILVGIALVGFDGPQLFSLIDVVVCGIGLAWLMVKPGRGPLFLLALYQILLLGFNVVMFSSIPYGDPMSKGLAANMLLRVIALISMLETYQGMRKGTLVVDR